MNEIDIATARTKSIPQGLAMLGNLRHLGKCTHVWALRNRALGQPVYVCGAGPSLELALPYLREHAAPIIAVNTALPALARAGVRPDLVSIMESLDLTAALTDLHEQADRLLVEAATAPSIVAAAKRPLFYHGPSEESRFVAHALRIPPIHHSGSALTGAIGCAMVLGYSPIVLCGVDLGYREGPTYSTGAMWALEMRVEGDRMLFEGSPEREALHDAGGQARVPRDRPITVVPAALGGVTYTVADYAHQAEWVSRAAASWRIQRVPGDGSAYLEHVQTISAPTTPPRTAGSALALDLPLGEEVATRALALARESLDASRRNAECVLHGLPMASLTGTEAALQALLVPGILQIIESGEPAHVRRRMLWELRRDLAIEALAVVC